MHLQRSFRGIRANLKSNQDCQDDRHGNEHHQNASMTNALQPRSSVELNTTEKKERLLDFVMAHRSVLFQVNRISSKSDGGLSKSKEKKSWKQSMFERNWMKLQKKKNQWVWNHFRFKAFFKLVLRFSLIFYWPKFFLNLVFRWIQYFYAHFVLSLILSLSWKKKWKLSVG